MADVEAPPLPAAPPPPAAAARVIPPVDWRLYCLDLRARKPLLLATIGTSLLVVATVTSLLLEMDRSCRPDFKVWLLICAMRSTIRLLCCYVKECIERELIAANGNSLYVTKLVEVIDIFGLVWFSVGNLLLFNGLGCSGQTPLVFYSSLAYVLSVYTFLFVPACIKLCVFVTPGYTTAEELLRVAILRDALQHRFAGDLTAGRGYNPPPDDGCHDLSDEQRAYWRQYLLACGQKEIDPRMPGPCGGPGGEDRQGAAGGDDLETNFCPICLGVFCDDEEASMGVRGNTNAIIGSSSSSYVKLDADAREAEPCSSSSSSIDGAGGTGTETAAGDDERGSDVHRYSRDIGGGACSGIGSSDSITWPPPDKLVCFPCSARHMFHSACLHGWLQISATKDSGVPSCPVCRSPLPQSSATTATATAARAVEMQAAANGARQGSEAPGAGAGAAGAGANAAAAAAPPAAPVPVTVPVFRMGMAGNLVFS